MIECHSVNAFKLPFRIRFAGSPGTSFGRVFGSGEAVNESRRERERASLEGATQNTGCST